jgi:hypothetical protein
MTAPETPSPQPDKITPWWKRFRLRRPLVLRLAKINHYGDAITWLLYTLFGGLLPFWGTALILLYIQRPQPFASYFSNGELAVFCAGLLTALIPVMRRRVKDAPIEHPESFLLLALISIAVILVLFASVTITRQLKGLDVASSPLVLNERAVLVTSFGLFAISILMGFFVELINNIRLTTKDVQAYEQLRAENLADRFNEARRTQDD